MENQNELKNLREKICCTIKGYCNERREAQPEQESEPNDSAISSTINGSVIPQQVKEVDNDFIIQRAVLYLGVSKLAQSVGVHVRGDDIRSFRRLHSS